ncbi:MAG: HAD hydrolase-like protein [Crinalium sp.]
MIETIIIDLDGPILEGKVRHYTCYRQILEAHGYIAVSLEEYWEMKCDRVPLQQQLAASNATQIHADFVQAWLSEIEQPELLALDRLQPGVIEKLTQWRSQGLKLVLATLRRYPEHLDQQLANFHLDTLLNHVLVCEHRLGSFGKVQQVKNTIPDISPNHSLWIGDTEIDIEAAKLLGCPIWAVSCGIRTSSYLASLSPDFISLDFTQIDLGCFYEN